MGKIFGIGLILVGIWVGLTIYTEGPEAFGGLFASADASDDEPYVPPHERAANRWAGAHETSVDRVDRALAEKGAGGEH